MIVNTDLREDRKKESNLPFFFPIRFLGEVVEKTFIKIFSTKYHQQWPLLQNALLNSRGGYIESSSIKIEDENVTLASNILIETVCNRSSHGPVDDSEDIHSRDSPGILCGLPLRVVELGRGQ